MVSYKMCEGRHHIDGSYNSSSLVEQVKEEKKGDFSFAGSWQLNLLQLAALEPVASEKSA